MNFRSSDQLDHRVQGQSALRPDLRPGDERQGVQQLQEFRLRAEKRHGR